MKNIRLVLLLIFTLVIIQNCTTTEKVATDKKATADEEINKEVQALKTMLGYVPEDEAAPDTKTMEQPLEFGVSVSAIRSPCLPGTLLVAVLHSFFMKTNYIKLP
jgi:hypothetical protein